MRYYPLLALLSLAAFFAASLLATGLVAAAWPPLQHAAARLAPGERARALVLLRLLPVVLGALSATAVAVAFLRFEPRETTEVPGALLTGAALVAIAGTVSVARRALRAARRARTCRRLTAHCRRWISPLGTVVSVVPSAYPVAAVIGLFRARYLLSTRILGECTPEEVELILAHERAHRRRRDNATRALLWALPDPLAVTGAGAAIEREWAAAAEEAADAEAAGTTDERRLALAAVLVRIARLADTTAPRWMPAMSFYQGDNLQRRIGELLAGERPGSPRGGMLRTLAGAAALTALTAALWGSRAVHDGVEWAVRVLP